MTRRRNPIAVLSLAALAWWCWGGSFAHAAPPTPTDADSTAALHSTIARYSVRVRTPLADDKIAYGSGVVLGDANRPLIVTNYHVVENALPAPRTIAVRPSGWDGWVEAAVVAVDTQMDLAALVAARPLATATTAAKFDERATYTLAGFGVEGKFHTHTIKPVQWTGLGPVGGSTWSWVIFDAPCCHGDSGGGIFNSRGEVVGVVWGSDGKAHATCGRPFREIIKRATQLEQK
jgi:S1-C subfamily serine protease